jgi:RimJ/RimL family protein N-acetyltransferase
MALEQLVSERCRLHALSTADAPFIYQLMNSPGYLQFVGDRGIKSVEDAHDYIQSYFLHSAEINGFGYFVARNHSGASIGVAGFLQKDYLQNPDIGFALLPKYFEQGFAFEICQVALSYAQSNWIFGDIDAITHCQNSASHRLLCKLQFTCQGEISNQDQSLKLYRRHRHESN